MESGLMTKSEAQQMAKEIAKNTEENNEVWIKRKEALEKLEKIPKIIRWLFKIKKDNYAL